MLSKCVSHANGADPRLTATQNARFDRFDRFDRDANWVRVIARLSPGEPTRLASHASLTLLGGGYPTTAPMIMTSIAKLGFDSKDVKVLVNSEPHSDHAGGLAVLQQASGAELWASEASADTIASGGDDPDMILPLRALIRIGIVSYPAARVDHRFKDGDTTFIDPEGYRAYISAACTP